MRGRTTLASPILELLEPPARQIAELDVLRTFAVACVLAGHLDQTLIRAGAHATLFSRLPMVRGGWMGVDLFFVLSGYFIGKQLWRELFSTHKIDFKRFVVRRGLRIWPLYFFTFLFVALVLGRGRSPLTRGWSDLVFLTNYVNHGIVMGSWSLCTEEQFYIIAPLLLIIGSHFLLSASTYRKALIAILFLLPLVRLLIWRRVSGSIAAHDSALWMRYLYFPIHTHCDGLVMGLLIANLEASGQLKQGKRFLSSPWALVVAIGLCALLQRIHREAFDFTGLALVFGSATWIALTRGWGTRIRSLHWIFYLFSRLSFGMYLNHEYVADWFGRLAVNHLHLAGRTAALRECVLFCLFFLLSAGIAVVTFCLIEYPFLRYRDVVLKRWKSVPSPAPIAAPMVAGVPAEAF